MTSWVGDALAAAWPLRSEIEILGEPPDGWVYAVLPARGPGGEDVWICRTPRTPAGAWHSLGRMVQDRRDGIPAAFCPTLRWSR